MNFIGGLVLSILCTKPQLLFVPLLFLLVQKKWRVLAGIGCGSVFFFFVSIITVGIEGLKNYIQVLFHIAFSPGFSSIYPSAMYNWSGFLQTILPKSWAWILYAMSLVILLGGYVYCLYKQDSRLHARKFDMQWGLVILLTIFLSPHMYLHDVSILIVCWIVLADEIKKPILPMLLLLA
jgi:hypothetical protein